MRDDYPTRGLVLASGCYFPTRRRDVWLTSGPAVPVLGDLISYTVAPIISWAILPGALRKIFAPRSVPQKFKNEFPASNAQAQTIESGGGGKCATHSNCTAISYSSIACQVRIFHGTEDQVIGSKQARELHQALHRSVIHMAPNAGHMVTYADPAAIAQAINSVASSS